MSDFGYTSISWGKEDTIPISAQPEIEQLTGLWDEYTPHPTVIRQDYYNPVIYALDSLDLAMLACRLFNSNTLPIIAIMLNRDCKAWTHS